MSIVKHQIATANDNYWYVRRMLDTLVEAVKNEDVDTIGQVIGKWDGIKEAEEQERKNFIRSLKSA
jgi:hypothetical protein